MAAMLRAPFVFELKWVASVRSGHRASVHARYIATREGVARAEEDNPEPAIHARYLDERPGSTCDRRPGPHLPHVPRSRASRRLSPAVALAGHHLLA